jgi:enolase-phosphatase E1
MTNNITMAILTDLMGTIMPLDFLKTRAEYNKSKVADFMANLPAESRELIERLQDEFETTDPLVLFDKIQEQTDVRNFKPDYMLFGEVLATAGYLSGELVPHVFEDVPKAFDIWQKNGEGIYIFSAGSAGEQEIMLQNSTQGDISGFVNGYYGTKMGSKEELETYRKIAGDIGENPSEFRFFSDNMKELNAADGATMDAILTVRPGNKDVTEKHKYKVVDSFLLEAA